jgi:aquaporin Z
MQTRKLAAEFIGTFMLVFFAVGVATLSFGFKLFGTSVSAGVVSTALAFGLVLIALAYTIGPISGCHINPAVTIGFLASGRMTIREAVQFWTAQFAGGIAGALVLWGVLSGSPHYSRNVQGLGADGFGAHSLININAVGAFATEVILTGLFVYVVLAATSKLMASPAVAGMAIGLALTVVHLIGIPITGTSVNPARSLGPALVVGGSALSQVWLFILAPLVGGVIAAGLYRYFAVDKTPSIPEPIPTTIMAAGAEPQPTH